MVGNFLMILFSLWFYNTFLNNYLMKINNYLAKKIRLLFFKTKLNLKYRNKEDNYIFKKNDFF